MHRYVYLFFKYYYLFTFIGTVVHEFAHKNIAEMRGLEIINVEYFTLEGASLGIVEHGPPKSYFDMFSISLAPLVINSLFAILSFIGLFHIYMEVTNPVVKYSSMLFLAWFGVSTGLHAFPSKTDVDNIVYVKKILWDSIDPTFKDKIYSEVTNTESLVNIIYTIILSPVLFLLTIYQVCKYIIFHPLSTITIPFVYFIYLSLYLKYIGFHIFYTVLLVYGSQYIYFTLL